MATIPNPEDQTRAIPGGQAPIATVRNSGAVAEAVSGVFNAASTAANKWWERKVTQQVASANSDTSLQLYELGNSFDQDEDYETMEQRYEETAREIVGKSGETIKSNRARTSFLEYQELQMAQGKEFIKDKAWGVEKDFKRAEGMDHLNRLQKMVVNGKGEEAIELAEAEIDAAIGANYFSEQEGVEMKKAFREDSVVAWLEFLPPEQRVDALNSDIADNLPDNVRATLLRKAKIDLLAQRGADTVNEWFEKAMTEEEMDDKASRIKDVKLRDEVERRYHNEWAARDNAETRTKQAILDKYTLLIRQGELTMDQMAGKGVLGPLAEIDSIEQEQMQKDLITLGDDVNKLFNAESLANGRAPQVSDRNVIFKLERLKANNLDDQLSKYFWKNSNELDATDFDIWAGHAAEAEAPDVYKGLTNAQTMLRDSGNTDYANNVKLRDWYREKYELDEGKLPTELEVQKRIDAMYLEINYDYNRQWMWGTELLGDMTKEELVDTGNRMQTADPERWRAVESVLAKKGSYKLFDVIAAFQKSVERKDRGRAY